MSMRYDRWRIGAALCALLAMLALPLAFAAPAFAATPITVTGDEEDGYGRLIFAWPTAQIAVMGGAQASKTMLTIKVAQLKKRGEEIDEEQQAAMLSEIQERYDRTTDPVYAAARLWVDGVIDPRHTREIVSAGILAASHNHEIPRFNPGVLQV